MGSFPADLSYCLPLLIGFSRFKLDHGRRLSAMRGVAPQVVVEGDPAPDTSAGRRPGFLSVRSDAFVFQESPQARHVEGIPAIGPK